MHTFDDKPPDVEVIEKIASTKGLDAIAQSAVKLRDLRAQLEKTEKAVTDLKNKITRLEEVDIPDIMKSLEIEEIVVEGGYRVKLVTQYHASISKENMPEAVEWLESVDSAGIVKYQVSIQFDKNEGKERKLFVEKLRAMTNRPFDEEPSIHPMTLKKFVREAYENGIALPKHLIPVHVRTVAEIKRKEN